MLTPKNFFSSSVSEVVEISPEVQEALCPSTLSAGAAIKKRPVVALESTIIAHGMPYPQNLEVAKEVEQIVRTAGAIPATIAVIKGKIRIGLTENDLEFLASAASSPKNKSEIWKINTRDLPYVLSTGGSGATTVSATIYCAEGAGIPIMVTGGIGGVHRGVANSWDISADLSELAMRKVAVISAGIKSILDIEKTLEYLETISVPVVVYGSNEFPAFYTSKSGVKVKTRLDTPGDIAKMLRVGWKISSSGGVLITRPLPKEAEASGDKIEKAIITALEESKSKRVGGKEVTPFLLERVCSLTGGESLQANVALIKNNAELGAKVAVELAKLNLE